VTNLLTIGYIIEITIAILGDITGKIKTRTLEMSTVNEAGARNGKNKRKNKATNEAVIGKSVIEDTPTKSMVRNAFVYHGMRGRENVVGPTVDNGNMNISTDHRHRRRLALHPRLRQSRLRDL
jgi:hypothetical protein